MRINALPARHHGFSLIELMIAVAIIGILMAVALPSYQDSVRKGRRADAQQFMLTLAQQNQQYFLDNRTYTTTIATLATTPSSVSSHYNLAITADAGPPATFSISAAPTGSQADDSCGTLTITSASIKSSSSGSGCW